MKKHSSLYIEKEISVTPKDIRDAELAEEDINVMLRIIDLLFFDDDRKKIPS